MVAARERIAGFGSLNLFAIVCSQMEYSLDAIVCNNPI